MVYGIYPRTDYWSNRYRGTIIEPDLTATVMLAFSSNSSRNQNVSDPTNEKTTLI